MSSNTTAPTSGITLGALTESAVGEKRVAIDPDATARLINAGVAVTVETGAGVAAGFPDEEYVAAGAAIATRKNTIDSSNILAVVRSPDDALVTAMHPGQVVVGLLDPVVRAGTMVRLAEAEITAMALELLPRTLSRTQSMDALSSQASAAGYRAVIVAADASTRYLPMMITAAGTAKPASVIVLGTGVAGLQAIATAKRLGAIVTGYDVRPTSKAEVESLGAQFMTSSVADAAGAGGYARSTSADESKRQQDELTEALTHFDIVITTAKVPGKKPPVLVTAEALTAMRRGSVCVDLAASEWGGNVDGSIDGTVAVTESGVTVIGAGNLASDLASSSSQMYARNVTALIESLIVGGTVVIDVADELQDAITVAHQGQLRIAAVRAAAGLDPIASPITEAAQ